MVREMKRRMGLGVCVVAALAGGWLRAELPSLPEKPWQEHFVVMESRAFTFGLNNWAEGLIVPTGKTGKDISHVLHLPVTFIVEEVMPDGKVATRKVVPESLESKDEAMLKPGKVSFRGKVTGEASFEAFVEVEGGRISLGGRLVDKGKLTKNPLRFGVRANFPSAYRNVKKTEKEDAREFAKKIRGDRYLVAWTDGKRGKFEGADKIEEGAKNVNGVGISEFKMDIEAYQGKVVDFTASANSRMEVWTRGEQAFHEGFSLNWYPDPVKDPEGKARVTFTVK